MPIIAPSTYSPPFFLTNRHIQTTFPSLFRRVKGVFYERERITTADNDFLDLDRVRTGARRLAILTHGLEGDSQRHYILGMVHLLQQHGFDALAWNFRGCSGEPNRTLRFYHSGETGDLHTVITHAAREDYDEIVLVGFSLGGNVTLKYLGERLYPIPASVKKAVTFSVPCDLRSSAHALARPTNAFYMRRFLRLLHEKIKAKMKILPGQIDDSNFENIRDFYEFDGRYTAPIHGFRNTEDYWQRSSSRQFLPAISIPTLLVNAADDPFLAPECYPIEEAKNNPFFFLEIPKHGGHCGFMAINREGEYWSEKRALEFLCQPPI